MEAHRLAEENGDHGFACFLQITIAKSLAVLRKYDEAIEVATKFISEVDAAIAATEADPTAISPVTGGRELDPLMMADVVDMQYSVAAWLFRKFKGEQKKSFIASARNHFKGAVAKEAKLPLEAIDLCPQDNKILCQEILSSLPLTTATQEAIQAAVRTVWVFVSLYLFHLYMNTN